MHPPLHFKGQYSPETQQVSVGLCLRVLMNSSTLLGVTAGITVTIVEAPEARL